MNLFSKFVFVFVAVLLVLSSACREPTRFPSLSRRQIRDIDNNKCNVEPSPQFKIGAKFDDKIELIGVDLSCTTASPKSKVKVTWYWRVLKETAGDWLIFVHLDSAHGRATGDHHAVGGLYPIRKWKAGEIIRDEQEIQLKESLLPPKKKTDASPRKANANLYVGIYDHGAYQRNQSNIRMKPTGEKAKTDKDQRLRAATLSVSSTAPIHCASCQLEQGCYQAKKVSEAPRIDGKLNDPAWSLATWTQPFRNPNGEAIAENKSTRAKILYDKEALYLGVTSQDSNLVSRFNSRDQELWKADVVELFIDPGFQQENYIEIQFSPAQQIFDALFTSHRKPDWPKASKAFNHDGITVRVSAKGTVNQPGDTDTSWTVEARIPFKGLGPIQRAPRMNSTWAFNLYRLDTENTRGTFVPVGNDYHKLTGAGVLKFGPNARVQPTARTQTTPTPLKRNLKGLIPVKRAQPTVSGPGSGQKKSPSKTPTRPKRTN